MDLNDNQSALLLEIDDAGEITVNVASGDHDSLPSKILVAIAEKLMGDQEFQDTILGEIED